MIKTTICIALAAFLCGCATARKSAGRKLTSGGQATGKTGTVILASSGICPLLIPVGVVIGVPVLGVGAALYYGGCAMSGDEIESDAFEL